MWSLILVSIIGVFLWIVYKDFSKTSPLKKVVTSKYVATGFVSTNTNVSSWGGRLRVVTSNDGHNWKILDTVYPKTQFRDGSIYRYHQTYYIVYTNGLMYTRDFKHWHHIKWSLPWKKYHAVWAPEFYITADKKVRIIVSAEETAFHDNLHMQLYTMSFNLDSGKIGNKWTSVTGDNLPTSMIDPNLTYYNGKYHLWYANNSVGGHRDSKLELAISKHPDSGYHVVKTDINRNRLGAQYEAPELVKIKMNNRNHWVLYQDPYNSDGYRFGITYAVMRNDDQHWSSFKKVTSKLKIRHFGILAQ